jgi:8-oxo-dGTP diphosphatase
MPFTYDYPRPSVTVDSLIFNFSSIEGLEVLLIQRANEPYLDHWAIPGGFVDMDEDLIPAAIRELKEETGMQIDELFEIGSFAKPNRDPRGRVITIAFWGFTDKNQYELKAADDAKSYSWKNINALPELAFDHKEIIEESLKKLKVKLLDGAFINKHFSSDETQLQTFCRFLFPKEDYLEAFELIKENLDYFYEHTSNHKNTNSLKIFFK